MDFMGRTIQSQQPARMTTSAPAEPPHTKRRDKYEWLTRSSRVATNALLFIVALLVATVAWFIYSSSPASQSKYVDNTKLQAVFLNTGQVYFGNVTSFNQSYLVLTNVYYLQSNSNNSNALSSNQNVSLVKLGCELHRPYDEMVVNTSQVTFWENLQSDGQVAQAVTSYNKQNPTHTCTSASSSSSSTNLQNQATGTNKQ